MCSVALAFPAALPIWRADQLDRSSVAGEAVRPTGHAVLDAELPGGGWPAAGLIELLLAAPGCGELRLLAPALAAASSSHSVLWVAPPYTPYAPALVSLGIAVDRLVLATPASAADAAWATEQALRSGTLSAVLWWQPGDGRTSALSTTLRRLHLAATEGHTPLFALRPAAARAQSSPAPLRLVLEPAGPSQLAVEVFKRRGPPMTAPVVLMLPGSVRRRSRPLRPSSAAREETNHAVVRPASERVAA